MINVIQEVREKTGITLQEMDDFSSEEFEFSNRSKPLYRWRTLAKLELMHRLERCRLEVKEGQDLSFGNSASGKQLLQSMGKIYEQAKKPVSCDSSAISGLSRPVA